MLPAEKRINTQAQLISWLAYEKAQYAITWKHYIGYLLGISEKGILWQHQVFLRKAEYHTNANHKLRALYYRFRLRRMQMKYLLFIPLNVCGKGLRIMHLGLIVKNSSAQVGENCLFHVNTTLVAKGTSGDAPVLDEGVIVGVGASVIGGVYVAKNVAIGALAVVTKDIKEKNVAVAGIPAKPISKNGAVEWKKTAQ